MMDSQENTLGQEKTEELNVAPADNSVQTDTGNTNATLETPAEAPAETAEADNIVATDAVQEQKKVYKSKKEVIERLKEIAHSDDDPQKDEVEYLKTTFYKLHFAEREADMKAYIEAGGDPDTYKVTPDEDENTFKAEMSVIKEKRAKLFLEQEKEKQENLKKKLDIIEKIKAMATSPEEANKSYQDFKKLQQEWKEIKLVPAEKANELWRNYQLYVEQYYDLLKLNNEAREYDFKKNLEIKTHLCEAAEKLADENDVISAFHQLQKLHQEYRETGPVAKELREEIWARFKAASTVINKRHQQHFEELRSKEEENLTKKTALCEKVEEIAKEEIKNAGDWDKKTKEIIAIQAEWKTIGFAPQKMNVKIFERFRRACDDFFKRKGEYFKLLKEELLNNLAKKKALCEQAEALKDSTDWKETGDKLTRLQKEWKTIGPVQKKYSDAVWKRFISACDYFFEQKKRATSSQHSAELDNLETKRGILARLKALVEQPDDENTEKTVRDAIKEWNNTGHVPFRDKDKLYKEFHKLVDELFDRLNLTAAQRRMTNFRSNVKEMAGKEGNSMQRERERLIRQYEAKKSEIQTYENNLGFLTAASKKGNSLVNEINRKVDKLKADLQVLEEQIRTLEDSMNQ